MRFESGRHRTAENFIRTKHVVAAGLFARDAGSIPAASTILRSQLLVQFRAKEDFLRYNVPSCGWQAFHNLNEDGQAVFYFSLFLFHKNGPPYFFVF